MNMLSSSTFRALMLRIKTKAIVVICLTGLPWALFAHHANSEYDQTTTVELEGVVASVFWRNPHVMVNLATIVDDEEIIWSLVGDSVSSQSRRGMTGDMIQVGNKVRVAGFVSTRRDNNMRVYHLLLPSGEELMLRGYRKPYWPKATQFAYKHGIDPDKVAAAKADGIFRVWSWGGLKPGTWFFDGPNKLPLTKAAVAKHAEWNEFEDNPQLDCIAPGMPNTMGNPHPIQFIKAGDNIEIHQEEFDVARTIHMGSKIPTDAAPSALGYSIGHWENKDTLVVATNKINWPYFNRVGVTQSEAVKVLERFTLDDEAGKLHYELEVTDPATLTEPFKWKGLWIWRPGEVVSEYNCTVRG